jgi:hypothetical protein
MRHLSLIPCIAAYHSERASHIPSPTFTVLPAVFDDLYPPFPAKELGLASVLLSVAPSLELTTNSRFSAFSYSFACVFSEPARNWSFTYVTFV